MKFQDEFRSLTQNARDAESTPDGFHGVLDHIHPHAAARNAADGGGRAEPWLKYDTDDLVFAHPLDLILSIKLALQSLGRHTLQIDPMTIILDRHGQAIIGAHGFHMNGSGWFLATFQAFLGTFDAVIDAVTNEMNQGIAQDRGDGVIHPDVVTGDHELNLLGQGAAQIMDDAGIRAEDGSKRDTANLVQIDENFLFGGFELRDQAVDFLYLAAQVILIEIPNQMMTFFLVLEHQGYKKRKFTQGFNRHIDGSHALGP